MLGKLCSEIVFNSSPLLSPYICHSILSHFPPLSISPSSVMNRNRIPVVGVTA